MSISDQRDDLLKLARDAQQNAYAPYSKFRVFAAVSKLGGANVRIRAIAVVNDHNIPCSPCGACRQVIAEFGPAAILWYQGANGIQQSTMEHLLPDCFRL